MGQKHSKMEREIKNSPRIFHPKGQHHVNYHVHYHKIDEKLHHLMVLDLNADGFSLIEVTEMRNSIHIRLIPPVSEDDPIYEGEVYGLDILAPIAKNCGLSLDKYILAMTSPNANHFRTVSSIISKKWYLNRDSIIVLMGLSLTDDWTLKLFDCALLQSL